MQRQIDSAGHLKTRCNLNAKPAVARIENAADMQRRSGCRLDCPSLPNSQMPKRNICSLHCQTKGHRTNQMCTLVIVDKIKEPMLAASSFLVIPLSVPANKYVICSGSVLVWLWPQTLRARLLLHSYYFYHRGCSHLCGLY